MIRIRRRPFLLGLGASAAGLHTWHRLHSGQAEASPVERYLQQLARDDGGYAWDEQTIPHLTPTFAVIGGYHILQRELPEVDRLKAFVREHHPAQWKKLEQEHREFELQQIQSLIWLGDDAHDFRDVVAKWTRPVPYLKQYERSSAPVMRHQVTAITARKLLGMSMSDLDGSMLEYIAVRRRENGSFNNTPTSAGGDGHVLNTLWALQALSDLGQSSPLREQTIAWLQACQRADGGFTWQPEPKIADVTNVTYTWAAVLALAILDAQPKQTAGAVQFILRHWNADGGFADRQGWLSSPVATYYALDCLRALGTEPTKAQPPRSQPTVRAVPNTAKPTDDLKVFSIQIEAHGNGSPADAVRLAQALRIDMWGAKNPKPGWIEQAQSTADRLGAPVNFFVANEEYGTWIEVPGLGSYSHMSDLVAPDAEAAAGSLASERAVAWQDFQERRISSLHKAKGRMLWQFGENEELVRLLLDDSLLGNGFSMISTFHFGNPDFTNTEPFLQHYRGRIPFIALQDAHGPEPWWFADMTTGFRTLFLAREATWESWLEALDKHWVAAVRRDAQSQGRLLLHTSSREVNDFLLERPDQWQWWDNAKIARPMLSLVAVGATDVWETGRPQRGIDLRLRCAWSNTNQGQLTEPLAELVSLKVDAQTVEPVKQQARGGRNPRLLSDQAFIWSMPDATPGKHTAVATVRVLADARLEQQSIEF